MKKILISILFFCNYLFATTTYESDFNDFSREKTLKLINNSIDKKDFSINTNEISFCGKLKKIVKNDKNIVISQKIVDTDIHITDFDNMSGEIICEYYIREDNQKVQLRHKFKEYKAILHFKSSNDATKNFISDKTVEKLNNLEESDFNIYLESKKLGIFKENFSLSQFITNLLTLNTEVVTGTDKIGNIQITPVVKEKMSILKDENAFNEFFKQNGKVIASYFLDNPENFNITTFSDFFDLKLFGFYYDFMGIAWGEIFSLSGTVILAIVVVYMGGQFGYNFFISRIAKQEDGEREENEKTSFIIRKLFAIGIVFSLSFIQYPTGSPITVNYEDGLSEEFTNKTSIAKETISFFADLGASVADSANKWVVISYLKYLEKATNNQSQKNIKELYAELENGAKALYVDLAFFEKNCVNPYSNQTRDNFQGVVKNSGYNTSSYREFSYEKVSSLLCKKIEKRIFLYKKSLNEMSKTITVNVDKLSGSSKDIDTLQYFIKSQIIATKELGWLNVASLPILHVFMKNSSIIESTFSENTRNLDEVGNSKTRDLLTVENTNKEEYEISFFDEKISSILGSSFYTMLPFFSDLHKTVEKLVETGATFLAGGSFKILNFLGIGKALTWISSFFISIELYKFLLASLFAGLICLLMVIRIVLYFIEMFIHFFVSPLIVLWTLTTKKETNKVHDYLVDGFVIYLIKPTLIVLSSIMFIFSFEIMLSLYYLIFDVIFANLEIVNVFDEADLKSLITLGAIKGFGEIGLYFFSFILAFFMIFRGDSIILSKFGYKENQNDIAKNIGERIVRSNK